MKTRLFLTLCTLVLGMSAQAKDYNYETVKDDLMQTRIYTLDNGLKVYLSVNPEKPPTSLYVRVLRTIRQRPQVWRTIWSI